MAYTGCAIVNRQIREPVDELKSAAETLRLDRAMSLAVQAMSAASERGFALAFTRSGSARPDGFCAALDGEILRQEQLGPAAPSWIVDIDAVPHWQRDCWIEPMNAGVHCPAYFTDEHPVKRRLGWRSPDYGRVMICHGGRLVAWAGLFIDGKRAFRDGERERLREVAHAIAFPLKLAALSADAPAHIELSPRQRQIADGVARGLTNKQIAHDLDISPATVKTILERLFRTSGAANRAALATWAASGARREM
jgi:DNA-binding CsgD family transcriptional regulator